MKYAIENGIIDIAYVQEQINMKRDNELLNKHPYAITCGNDGFWRTYLPTENGKRKQIKKKNETDIKKVVIEYWKSQCNNTFKDRYDVWIERQKICGRSDNTIYKYEADYKRFFEGDSFEILDIRNITDEDISSFIRRLLSHKDIPYKALKGMFGYMKGVFDKSIIDKIIEKNPCNYVDLPMFKQFCKEPDKKTSKQRTLSSEEKCALLKKINKSDSLAKHAVELSLYTGMRVGELSALKWEDIDYNNETITICRSEKYSRISKEYYISTTKNDKIRKIPLTDNMKDVLYRTKEDEIRKGYISEFVFCDENGRIHANRISCWTRNNTLTKEFYNVKSIHAIRRTLNSNMKCMGVSTPVAAAILGHTEKVNEENYTYDTSSMTEKKKVVELAGKIS